MKTQPTDTKQIMRQDLNSSEKNVEKIMIMIMIMIMRQQVTYNEINGQATNVQEMMSQDINSSEINRHQKEIILGQPT